MVGGGGCTYDYNVSLSPNIWIMTFNLDLDLDLGLTIISGLSSLLLVPVLDKTTCLRPLVSLPLLVS